MRSCPLLHRQRSTTWNRPNAPPATETRCRLRSNSKRSSTPRHSATTSCPGRRSGDRPNVSIPSGGKRDRPRRAQDATDGEAASSWPDTRRRTTTRGSRPVERARPTKCFRSNVRPTPAAPWASAIRRLRNSWTRRHTPLKTDDSRELRPDRERPRLTSRSRPNVRSATTHDSGQPTGPRRSNSKHSGRRCSTTRRCSVPAHSGCSRSSTPWRRQPARVWQSRRSQPTRSWRQQPTRAAPLVHPERNPHRINPALRRSAKPPHKDTTVSSRRPQVT